MPDAVGAFLLYLGIGLVIGVLISIFRPRRRKVPTWICPCCRQAIDEPAPTFDPADLDPLCPNCGTVLNVTVR